MTFALSALCPWRRCRKKTKEVLKENYDLVYTSQLYGTSSTNEKLELIWEQFSQDHPIDYHSPSLSVSDIVALKQNGVVTCHYCDSFGFTELSGFLPRQSVKKTRRWLWRTIMA